MKLLLDTNVVIRWATGSPFPARLMTQIQKAEKLWVSVVTPWELAIKVRHYPPKKFITCEQLWSALNEMSALMMPIKREHSDLVATLPEHHHDPFDRMIIAQCISEGVTVVSSDERFPNYKPSGLRVLWQ